MIEYIYTAYTWGDHKFAVMYLRTSDMYLHVAVCMNMYF